MAFPNGRPRPRDGNIHRTETLNWEPVAQSSGTRTEAVKHHHWISDRLEALLDGRLTMDDLDDEEIIQGRLRNSRGNFAGRPPQLIPHSLHAALRSTMEKRMERKMIQVVPEMIDRLSGIANNPRAAANARVQAAVWLIERAIGKTVDRQQITAEIKAVWEEAASSGAIFVDIDPAEGEGDPNIVEADLVEPKEIVTIAEPETYTLPEPELDPRAQGAIDYIEPEPPKKSRPRVRLG